MFWGLIMEPHRSYSQVVERSFHISKAALDIFAASDDPTQVILTFKNKNFLLCTLQKGVIIQCNLDLNFEAGDEVVFATNGSSNIHLTGYIHEDVDTGDFEGEEEESEVEDEESEVESDDEEVEPEEKTSKRKSGKAGSEGLVFKKSKTAQLLEEVSNNYNSDDDPTFNFSQDDSSDDDDIEDEEDSEDDEELGALELSNDDVFVSDTNGTSRRTRNRKPIPTETIQKENKTPKKQEFNNGKSPKLVKTPKNEAENKTPKNKTPKNKTPGGQNDKLNKTLENGSPKKKIIEGGLVVQDLKEGDGKSVKDGNIVQVYYEGRFKNNNKMFDSSKSGPGFKFRVGKREVIKGWDLALVGMKIGGKRRITCPPSLAYGQKGAPPSIPPNSTLIFDIELKKIN